MYFSAKRKCPNFEFLENSLAPKTHHENKFTFEKSDRHIFFVVGGGYLNYINIIV